MTENQPQDRTSTGSQTSDFDTSRAVLRLLVGLTLEGVDELTRRLREWEEKVMQPDDTSPPVEEIRAAEPASLSEGDRLYYALIGAAFAARERAARDLPAWLAAPGEGVQQVIDTAERLTENPVLRPLVKPVKAQAETVGKQINAEVERWIAIGQAEAGHSRAVARIAVPEIIDEVLESLAENPELQDLIQQQSVGLAGEVVDSMREVTVTADTVVEAVVRRLLGRKPRRQLPAPDNRLLPEPVQNGHKEPSSDERT